MKLLTGSRSEIRLEPPRAGDIRDSKSNPSTLYGAGWKPESSMPAGLRETLYQTLNA